jgi:regulator of protease activity HflC (stomatin/prohibitin superfamily)
MPVLARTVDISAQEMLTADRLQVKLTAVVVYRVIDARKAMGNQRDREIKRFPD